MTLEAGVWGVLRLSVRMSFECTELSAVAEGRMEIRMKSVRREMISTLLYLLGVLCLTWFIITFIGQRTVVDGSSMEPTLSDEEHLIVDKITYRFSEPKRFDIIVFPFQHQENTYYIKRIIGLPGETVQIDEQGRIYINGEVLSEGYGREVIRAEYRGIAAEPVTLGEDEYFVMGDNRNNSKDSRTEVVGNVHRKDIVGRAWLRIYPFSKFGLMKHG